MNESTEISFADAAPHAKPGLPARRSRWFSRRSTLIVASALAVVVCLAHGFAAGANTERAAGVGYLCLALVLLGCGSGFWARAQAAEGTLRVRWTLITSAAVMAAMGYLPSFSQFIFHTAPQRQMQAALFNGSEALYLLSAVLFFSRVRVAIVLVDMLLALLYLVLRFNLFYSPLTRDHFTGTHLAIAQLMAFSLFLVAAIACLGAASRGELKFLRTLSCFFALRLVAFFLADQVSYTWLHYGNCSEWEVPGTVMLAGFVVYLIYTSRRAQLDADSELPFAPSAVVRSLMPSVLALVDVMLGLFLLRNLPLLAMIAISVALVCYVARAVLLDVQATHDKRALEMRNEHLEGLAVCDPLTGIGNRRSLAGSYAMLRSSAQGRALSLLLIDIDHFKQANDSYGHLYGDKVLVTVARALDAVADRYAGSACARFGGDEFALLLVDVSPERAAACGEELRAFVDGYRWEDDARGVSLSVGVASLREVGDLPLESLISYADKALYRAKLLGRNCVEAQPLWGADAHRTQAVQQMA